jgi:TetR/AcrR family transcriptional repressor of bet genes
MRPEVLELHRRLWGRYRASIQRRITAAAAARGLDIDIRTTTLVYTQLIDGLWLGWVLEDAYDLPTCRKVMRDWLCMVFREDPANHPAEPPLDVSTLPDPRLP